MAKEKQAEPAEPAEPAKISFHAAVLQSDGSFGVESFGTLEELATRLKALINQDVTVFAFTGDRLHVSKPPLRYLLVPGRDPVPLFDVPTELEPDDTGYLGVDPINLQAPPEINTQRAGKTAEPLDDFFGEDSGRGQQTGNVMGVFDDALPDPDS
jgi:hypothetical protein